MTIFTVLIPLGLILKVAVWAEWRLRDVIFNAPVLDLASMFTAYCAALAYLLCLAAAGGQLAMFGAAAVYEIMALAGMLTVLATPMSVLLIAIRPWPKRGPDD